MSIILHFKDQTSATVANGSDFIVASNEGFIYIVDSNPCKLAFVPVANLDWAEMRP